MAAMVFFGFAVLLGVSAAIGTRLSQPPAAYSGAHLS